MAYDSFERVFVSECGGDLVSKDDCRVIRKQYSFTFSKINSSLKLRATIRNGGYVWPGGYPLYLINNDGDCICFACAKKEYKSVARDLLHNGPLATECNFENDGLYCEYCNEQIKPAYSDD